jgi:hypothetical protein
VVRYGLTPVSLLANTASLITNLPPDITQ